MFPYRGYAGKWLYVDLTTEKIEPCEYEPELAGTLVPNSGRVEVIAKSPLTGIYGDANAGGFFGPELKYAGWDAIVVTWITCQKHTRLTDTQGLSLPYLRERTPHTSLAFTFDQETCTLCGRCITACAYGARHLSLDKQMSLDESTCRSCGLCITVCSVGALRIRRE